MRTTADLPGSFFRKLKAAAALLESRFKQCVNRAVERNLSSEFRPRRREFTFPLIRGREKRVLSLTNAQIDRVLFD
jgi:hypothetical protein